MALPASGAMSFSQLQTEFGGANPISLSEYYRGGAYVPSGTANGGQGLIATSGAISFNTFHGTQRFVVRTSTTDVRADVLGAVPPTVSFNTDGTTSGAGISGLGWGIPTLTGIGSAYWVNVASGSGTGANSGATRAVWLQLNTARAYSITAALFGSIRSRTSTYQISTDAAGVTIVGGGSIVWVSDNS